MVLARELPVGALDLLGASRCAARPAPRSSRGTSPPLIDGLLGRRRPPPGPDAAARHRAASPAGSRAPRFPGSPPLAGTVAMASWTLGSKGCPDRLDGLGARLAQGADEEPVRGRHALVEVRIRGPGREGALERVEHGQDRERAPRAGLPGAPSPARAPPGDGRCRSRRAVGDSAPAPRRAHGGAARRPRAVTAARRHRCRGRPSDHPATARARSKSVSVTMPARRPSSSTGSAADLVLEHEHRRLADLAPRTDGDDGLGHDLADGEPASRPFISHTDRLVGGRRQVEPDVTVGDDAQQLTALAGDEQVAESPRASAGPARRGRSSPAAR